MKFIFVFVNLFKTNKDLIHICIPTYTCIHNHTHIHMHVQTDREAYKYTYMLLSIPGRI